MNTIARHIEFLLQRNDCVVVPRLGAFIIRHTEAHYDSIKRQFFPPTDTVIFNPELDHNDGMLAKSIARANSISYEDALQKLNEQVSSIKETLKNTGHVEIGSVGSFTLDGKRRTFTPKGNYAIVHKLASLKPLAVTTVQMRAEDLEDKTAKSVSKTFVVRLDNLFRVAASIILILLAGLLCSTPITVDKANITFASVYPSVAEVEQLETIEEQPEPEPEPEVEPESEPEKIVITEIKDEPKIDEYIDVIEPVEKKIAEPKHYNENIHFDLADPYVLVVSSFDTYSKAKKFMASNQEFKMSVFEKGGRYRVYAATGKTKEDAALALKDKDFAKRYPSAWSCEK